MAASVDGAVLIGLPLGSETFAGSYVWRAFYTALYAAVKEALWHAVSRSVRAVEPMAYDDCARTGITGPCQVWYLTARLALLRWKSLSIKFASACVRPFLARGRTK